jgi:hypothetical protein
MARKLYNTGTWSRDQQELHPRRKVASSMGNVIFVLAVVAFWALVFVLVTFLIRMSTSSRDNDQVDSDLSEDYHETTDSSTAPT